MLVIKLNRRRPRDLQPTRRWKDNIKTYLKDAGPKCILRHLGDQFRKNDMGGACGTYEGLEICLILRLLMSYIYIYGAPILDVSRSHTTTHHSR